MLNAKVKGLLQSIIKYCQRIEKKMVGLTRKMFEENQDVREIICFNIFQIGELAKHLPDEFCAKYNQVPWGQIKRMRDVIGHGYDTVENDIVWDTAKEDVKPLEKYCASILKEQ